MAVIDGMPAISVVRGFRGVLDYYVSRGRICVRKWPTSKLPGYSRARASTNPRSRTRTPS